MPAAGIPDVSVIVVNWNLKETVRSCLESIQRHRDGLSVETIFIDNASVDGSADMVEDEFPEALVIRNADNVGFSRANNQAIEMARGRYLLLLNNDALLQEGALVNLVRFMDSHPHVGISGPRVINEDGTLQVRSKGRYPTIPRALGHFFLPVAWQQFGPLPLGLYESADSRETRPVDWMSACAILVRLQAARDIGPLDAGVFMYCEDVDWCYRMKLAGWGVYFVPAATVLHYAGLSMKKQIGKAVGAHKDGQIAFYSKYHGAISSKVFTLTLWAGYSFRAAGWLAGSLRGREAGLDKLKRMFPFGSATKR